MAQHLRHSAGIFEYIAASCAPNTASLLQEKIPEKMPQTFSALAAFVFFFIVITLTVLIFTHISNNRLSLAEAQQLTVKKAILNKSSVPLVTKLMVDCRNRYANTANLLKSISEGDSTIPGYTPYLLLLIHC